MEHVGRGAGVGGRVLSESRRLRLARLILAAGGPPYQLPDREATLGVILPHYIGGRDQWSREYDEMARGRKRIQGMELTGGAHLDYPPFTAEQASEMEGRLRGMGWAAARDPHDEAGYLWYLAHDPKHLQFWLDNRLTLAYGSRGQPYLAGWMLGYSTGAITAYYLKAGEDPRELEEAHDHDLALWRKAGYPDPPEGPPGVAWNRWYD